MTELSDYDTVVSKAQLILSILPPASAEGCAELYAAAVRRVCVNADAPVYADCNAVSPTTTRRIGEIVAESGSLFVDGSIIGPPPREKGSTRFYASGPDLDLFLQLQQFGLDVRVAGRCLQGDACRFSHDPGLIERLRREAAASTVKPLEPAGAGAGVPVVPLLTADASSGELLTASSSDIAAGLRARNEGRPRSSETAFEWPRLRSRSADVES